MVEQFFSVDYANCEKLFEGLSIWEDEKYRELQGTYPEAPYTSHLLPESKKQIMQIPEKKSVKL